MKKQNKGITLVALVITIIVLIILAGVSINTVMNQGLITNAKDARREQQKASEKEFVQLAVMASLNNNGEVEKEKLKNELTQMGFIVTEENLKGTGPYTFISDTNMEYIIETTGKIYYSDEKISFTPLGFYGDELGGTPLLFQGEKIYVDKIQSENGKLNLAMNVRRRKTSNNIFRHHKWRI